ncbi:molybdopterin-binding protein [Nitrososphaera sp.]|uniref:competence/damage-inducible protein A n=1 Tax=Nitrososphaera sp. TaxID=1971748 RepID=UPI0017A22C50|nr:molybdopterin-binding protein [Nitrososphaera sp.]NWG36561.1 competence damage-inducible protein A [Nitrososphaera sp.]
MFTIEILCVGNELLSGITLNTNAHWLAGRIARAGGTVGRVTVVGDDLGAISSAVKESLARKPDLLIVTGGLGATYDDMTLEGVAMALGKKIAIDERAVQMLKNSYARRHLHYRINKVRLKMATIPEGSTPIENTVGSAPSVMIGNIFCLPGVPAEMKAVFESRILPLVKEGVGRFVSKEVNYYARGVSEAMIAPALARIVRANGSHEIYLKTHPKGYYKKTVPQIRVQLVCKGADAGKVKQKLDKISAQLRREIKRLGGRIA